MNLCEFFVCDYCSEPPDTHCNDCYAYGLCDFCEHLIKDKYGKKSCDFDVHNLLDSDIYCSFD